VTAVGLQWSLFTESFFHQLYNNVYDWHYVDVNIYSLLNCLYAISAVLISFGALIGKISPLQVNCFGYLLLSCSVVSVPFIIYMLTLLCLWLDCIFVWDQIF
jgi:hypothetical protein